MIHDLLAWPVDQLHRLTHGHLYFTRAGTGAVFICYRRRWWPGTGGKYWFRPDLPGAGWHRVPDWPTVLKQISESVTALDAMAILREAQQHGS